MPDYYTQYISSEAWRQKREQVLKRDSHQCQTCLSTEDLEVHHKTYDRLGNEDMSDLITLCHECHEAITSVIRARRYSAREIKIEDHQPNTYLRSLEHDTTKDSISDTERESIAFAQWTDSRSTEQICEADEANLRQTRQDGRRF